MYRSTCGLIVTFSNSLDGGKSGYVNLDIEVADITDDRVMPHLFDGRS